MFFIIGLLLTFHNSIIAQDTLDITDFGAKPNSWADVMPCIHKAIESIKGKEHQTLSFPKGRYDFYPIRYVNGKEKNIGLELRNIKNLTIDGNGSVFVFHGNMGVAVLDSCENITLRNFSVDWDRPYISQVRIVESADQYLDVHIDRESYPYIIESGKIMFTGEAWKRPGNDFYNNLFTGKTKEIVSQTWDKPLGDIFLQPVEERGEGILRFYGQTPIKPTQGDYVTIYHARYQKNGFLISDSKNTLLQQITVHHALGHGIYAIFCENLSLDRFNIQANENKGRVFSIVSDGTHILNCKGLIKVENCEHTGLGDDFINLHGRNMRIAEVVNSRTLRFTTSPVLRTGDEVWWIDRESNQRKSVMTVSSIEKNAQYTDVVFQSPLAKKIKSGDFIENKTWTAGLEIRNCRILKRHRARGILVSTPKDVIIENNYFRTAGAAILMEGDTDYWLESGALNNVIIRNNVFEDCLTSGNRDGSRWQWGDAVITITPSYLPQSAAAEPYHRNIRITNNLFRVFDAPILRGRSVGELQFVDNTIEHTTSYKPYAWQKSTFLFDGCRNVLIKGNTLDPLYKTRTVLIEHMKRSDVKAEGFSVELLKNVNTYMEWKE